MRLLKGYVIVRLMWINGCCASSVLVGVISVGFSYFIVMLWESDCLFWMLWM